MIHPNFLSAASRLELERCLRRHREEYGIARRANAILLLDKGKSCAEIAEFLYLDDDTIRGWYKAFRQEGWDALALDGRHGRQSRLTPDQEQSGVHGLTTAFATRRERLGLLLRPHSDCIILIQAV